MQKIINSQYEHKLAYIYHQINKRGLLLHEGRLNEARELCKSNLNDICSKLTSLWGFPVYIGRENIIKDERAINLNAPEKVLDRLKEIGYDVPKIRKKDEETHEYEFEESVSELALRKLYADSSRWPSALAGEGIKLLLNARELITFRNRYVNAKLFKGQYFSDYNVAGTVTGRRGSKKSVFGFGGNAQNFPARGWLSDIWKKLIISRPGKIFFFVDQVSAEDWPVQALSQNHTALDEMRRGVNRHYKFASAIFGRSVDELKRGRKDRNSPVHEQCEMEYYFGKKGRHANNYGMQPNRLNESLAGEGYSIPIDTCKHILTVIDREDPNVKRIFHKYIQDQAFSLKLITTPLGRERHVLGLRNGERNYAILNELYAYIPQSLIGDNTGLAVTWLFDFFNGQDNIVQESHDSLCQEIQDNEHRLIQVFLATREAFNRDIQFHNGISVNIPVEGKIGYNWLDTVEIPRDKMNEDGIKEAYAELQIKYPREAESAKSIEETLA